MIAAALCCVLGACSGEMFGPDAASAVSANVTSAGAATSRMRITVRDTSLTVGDTTSLAVAVRDRFGRDISRLVGLKYRSTDTATVTVATKGVVTSRGAGTAWVVVRSSSGSTDSVQVSIAARPVPVPVSSTIDSSRIAGPDSVSLSGVTPPFNAPMLPADSVDVRLPAVTGRSIRVAAGDAAALQAALNSAVGGDEIVLPNNAEYLGSFVLPRHSGTGTVTLRSESVPAAGVRVTPATSASFARLVTTDSRPALLTATGARNWRVIAVSALLRNTTDINYGIVRIGDGGEAAMSDFVSDIVLDRIFVTAGTQGSTRRCVGLNGNALAVINSWLIECHSRGFDSQAVGGWTGMGPFRIENNRLEASTETVAFGGADPRVSGVTPSDITIRGNYLYRPMNWAGSGWLIKNHFELKHAKRVLFEGNVLENNWIDGQVGFAILFQAVSQDGAAPWTTVQDVTVRNNIVKNSTSGVNVISRVQFAGIIPTDPTRRILFANNLFLGVGTDPVSGNKGRLAQFIGDLEDLTLFQNTFVGDMPNVAVGLSGNPEKRFTLANNVFPHTLYGLFGSAEGSAAVAEFAPRAVVEGNVFTARVARMYPSGNSFPATLALSDFVNPQTGDYSLRPNLPYASHGSSIVGLDGRKLLAATATAVAR